jgi:hypothetical protein
MAVQLPNGKNQFFTSAGAFLVGGKVYTYIAGTSTPKDTYTTSTAGTPNANPVILNARGEAEIYWTGAYDVVLKDAADVTIWGPVRLEEGVITGNLSVAGNATITGTLAVAGAVSLGDAQADTVSIGGVVHKNAAGNWVFPAPSSGTTITATAVAGGQVAAWRSSGAAQFGFMGMGRTADDSRWGVAGATNDLLTGSAQGDTVFYTAAAQALIFGTNSIEALRISSARNATFAAPVSGVGVTMTGFAGSNALNVNGGTSGAFSVTTTGGISAVAGAFSAAVTGTDVTGSGNLRANGASSTIGYGTGAGGTVTQITSKATQVTLNKGTGQITMDAAALGAGAVVSFEVLNSLVGAADVIALNYRAPGLARSYRAEANNVNSGGGGFYVTVTNTTAGSLSEAVTILFAVIKGSAT